MGNSSGETTKIKACYNRWDVYTDEYTVLSRSNVHCAVATTKLCKNTLIAGSSFRRQSVSTKRPRGISYIITTTSHLAFSVYEIV